ncbi:MAG: flagellar motor protein MotB [Edaphobacter sp.]|uniref:flagellar motor protein MotB n=1 Tax=Edaphobacter sp. TaxID=1934404 RepID=UPI002387D1B6|nr:flagellar motor protein MotB [Edaphobacter sp.]MDE1175631.1 flagellar motor protein MotB [Edaphobacter sp.]
MSRKRKHEHVNHERWLVSYADFITLLFAFFVVLFASSQSDKKKQSEVAAAMQSAFRPLGSFEQHSRTPPIATNSSPAQVTRPAAIALPLPPAGRLRLDLTEHRINQLLRAQVAKGGIPPGSAAAYMTPKGLVISLREIGFFPSGTAEIQPSALALLINLAATLPDAPLRIEGHTDNLPIHTAQYATNWELSTARASAIARLLLEHGRLQPANLSAAGYAEFHPVASNETEEGRRRNRRVDIILLRDQAPSQ